MKSFKLKYEPRKKFLGDRIRDSLLNRELYVRNTVKFKIKSLTNNVGWCLPTPCSHYWLLEIGLFSPKALQLFLIKLKYDNRLLGIYYWNQICCVLGTEAPQRIVARQGPICARVGSLLCLTDRIPICRCLQGPIFRLFLIRAYSNPKSRQVPGLGGLASHGAPLICNKLCSESGVQILAWGRSNLFPIFSFQF